MNMDRKPDVEQSLLVVHQGALGDFIVTFPVLKALRVSFSRIDGICRSSFGRLAVDVGVMDRYHPLESARFASLYADRIDPGVNQLVSFYSQILLISFSAILELSMRKVRGNRVFRIAPWPEGTHNIQVSEFLADQVRKSGILSGVDREKFKHAFLALAHSRRIKLPPGATIVLSPGAGNVKKRWPLERFLVVAAKLLAQGLRVVILLGPAEADIEAALKQRKEPQPAVVTCQSFPDLLTLLDSADGFIGNDSGVSHLAAFIGLPVLVVFGPSDPERWRPFGANVSIVIPSDTSCPRPNPSKVDCREPACIEQISTDQVLAALYRAFGWSKSGAEDGRDIRSRLWHPHDVIRRADT